MAKKNSTVAELVDVLRKGELANNSSRAYQNLKKANDFYNKMLSEGTIKKRGYTLRGIEDSHLFFKSIP